MDLEIIVSLIVVIVSLAIINNLDYLFSSKR